MNPLFVHGRAQTFSKSEHALLITIRDVQIEILHYILLSRPSDEIMWETSAKYKVHIKNC